MKTFRTTGTGNEQTLSEIETDKIPLYPSEQDLLDDLANLEVGQIAGTVDPAESELIGTLIQRIQELESKLESDDVYSTDEVKTNKKWIDGKWIYKKTFQFAQLVNNDVVCQKSDYSIETLVTYEGLCGRGNATEVGNLPYATSSYFQTVMTDSTNVVIYANQTLVNPVITLYYTKTSA